VKPVACIQRASCHSHVAGTTRGRRNRERTTAAFHAGCHDDHRQTVSYSLPWAARPPCRCHCVNHSMEHITAKLHNIALLLQQQLIIHA